MIIENAKYTKDTLTEKNSAISCVIDGKHFSVPIAIDNRHYQAIQEWVAEGNKIEEAD
tara:strand:+ start:1505 stop:1678 length:174 start_codon:yes stop_codon:yes gene_type:complete